MTRNISEERGSQFTPWRKTVITHSTCSLRPKRALLRHISSVPYVQIVHCYVTSCLFLTSKPCIVAWRPVCTLVQTMHCYVTSCLFLTSKSCIVTWRPVCTLVQICIITWRPVCSLRPNRALLGDVLSVPYVQIVHYYVTSCLFLTSRSCIVTWHPVCSLCPNRALLRDILSRICHQLTFNVVTIRHAQPAPYPQPAVHKPLPPTTA